jgi:hypothetical protein
MMHLIDDSNMDDEFLMEMASTPCHHLFVVGGITYRALYISPCMAQIDDDTHLDLDTRISYPRVGRKITWDKCGRLIPI